jgi:HK97 family phage prohead protease
MTKIKLPDNEEVVRRSYGLIDMRAMEDGKTIEGHAAVYDQKTNIGDHFYEIIERGAFDGTDFDDVPFLANHNDSHLCMARSRRNNGNSTMQLKIDEKGLYTKASLDIEGHYESKALYSAVSRGDITGMSFLFRIADAKWTDLDTDMPTRHITKIRKVYDVSAVNWPAYAGTDISARDAETLDNAKHVLDNARSQLENLKAVEERQLLKLKIKIKTEV